MDLERSFRAQLPGKATSFDGIPTELAKRAPVFMANYWYPLLVKQACLNAEAVQLKGGIIAQAYKGRGPMDSCESYRALLVSSMVAKTFHRVQRSDLVKQYGSFYQPLQLGGLPGQSVSQAAHGLLLFTSGVRAVGDSGGILFVDVKQAFYRLLREHLFQQTGLDAAVFTLFSRLNFPPEAFGDFLDQLRGPGALECAGVDPYLQESMKEALTGTWFMLHGDERISMTRRGSRPGDNLADLLFSFSLSRILGYVIGKLRSDGLVLSVDFNPVVSPFHQFDAALPTESFDCLGPIWADDIAVLLRDDKAERLTRKMQVVAAELLHELRLANMEINYGMSKTEIVLDLRGAGSRKVKTDLYRHDPACLQVTCPFETVFVRVVGRYKHLGTWHASGGSMAFEIRSRLAQAHAEFSRLRQLVFGNKSLSVGHRCNLFHTFVMSGLLYNIAVWPPLSKSDASLFEAGLHRVYRRFATCLFGPQVLHWRACKVRTAIRALDGAALFSRARLQYLRHLVMKGTWPVWAMIQQFPQWSEMLKHDFHWLRRNSCSDLPIAEPWVDWSAWVTLMVRPTMWSNLVRRAADRHMLLEQSRLEDVICLDGDKDAPACLPDACSLHLCLPCLHGFGSRAAWSVHAFRCHGYVKMSRSVAEGVQCGNCLKVFALHSRLVNHLEYSVDCRRALEAQGRFVQKQPSCNSRHEKGQVDLACKPALQAFGPLPRPKIVVRQLPFFCEEQLYERLFDIYEEAIAEDLDCSCASTLLRDSISSIPIHPADALTVIEMGG